MSHAIKVLIILVSIGVLIFAAFRVLIEYPYNKNLKVDQRVLQNINMFERSCEEISSNHQLIKAKCKGNSDYPGNIANGDFKYLKLKSSDSLKTTNLILFIGVNTDSSLYYLTGFKGSYIHVLCYEPNNKSPSLLFAKRENIKSIDTIKPNWTYAIVQMDFD